LDVLLGAIKANKRASKDELSKSMGGRMPAHDVSGRRPAGAESTDLYSMQRGKKKLRGALKKRKI